MPKFIDITDLNTIVSHVVKTLQEQGVIVAGQFIGFVTNGDSFPTLRPDGSELKDLDYVKPKDTSEFPFTIDAVTFSDKNDRALYDAKSSAWILETGSAHSTSDLDVTNSDTESLSGTAPKQSFINIENKNAIEGKLDIEQGSDNVNKIPIVDEEGKFTLKNSISCGTF